MVDRPFPPLFPDPGTRGPRRPSALSAAPTPPPAGPALPAAPPPISGEGRGCRGAREPPGRAPIGRRPRAAGPARAAILAREARGAQGRPRRGGRGGGGVAMSAPGPHPEPAAPGSEPEPAAPQPAAGSSLGPLLHTLEDPGAPPGELTDAHLTIVR